MIAAFLYALLAIAVGWPATRIFTRDCRRGEKFALSFLFGALGLGAILFLLSLAHIAWTRVSFVVSALLLVACLSFIAKKRACTASANEMRGSAWAAAMIHALTCVVLFGYARFSTSAPIWAWGTPLYLRCD